MRLPTAFGVSLLWNQSRVVTRYGATLALFAFATVTAAEKNPVVNIPLNVKLGLWQMTHTTERNGMAVAHAIAPELLAKMRPDQRTRTEARLKARAAQGPQIETRRYCITAERLKNAIFDNSAAGPACQRTTLVSTTKLQQFHEECEEANAKRLVEGNFEALDAETMKGSLKVKSEGVNTYTMNVEIAGRWVAADCGNEPK